MKLLQVYNQYRSLFNGEENVVEQTARLVEKHGGQARLLMRSSRDIKTTLSGKAQAFWSGIYSHRAYRQMLLTLEEDRPDIVHVHNLYPLFSPSILVACRRAGVPTVMSVHNQQLTCPRSDHLRGGKICERCLHGREYNCVLQNCRDNIIESVAYAARTAFARKMRLFHDNVTLFIALSRFAERRLVEAEFAKDRIVVLPNTVPISGPPGDPAAGHYVAFAGRMSPEKGVDTLLDAARALPQCRVRLAGDGPLLTQFRRTKPPHVDLPGPLSPTGMQDLYRAAKFFVLPSKTYEMCPLVILEAMSYGLPVITSRLGAQAEFVRDGETGLLFEPGDQHDLARKIQHLWDRPDLCRRMGRAAYEIALRDHAEDAYYDRLVAVYRRAIEMKRDFSRTNSPPAVTDQTERQVEEPLFMRTSNE